MIVLGIDPGIGGALAALRDDGGYITHLPMPTIKVGSKSRVNGAAVAAFCRALLENHGQVHAFLEQVGSMPGQGVSSMFTFGHAAGLVEGVIAGAGIPLTLVTPQAWKKAAGLIGQDKDAARSRAVQLYPGLRVLDQKAKGQALADALLIARHGLSLV
ncbi:MAG TPA: crossover junction endodeoxyribonuclease RuvC [Pseudomonas sp.]|nr:crossover junction endodeoxyribonuclease RuvC [Pseudomonas sp.]